MSEDADMKRVEDAVNVLSEHFESVQVMVTRHEEGGEGGTVNCALGSGNFFTRYGQIREWLINQEERSRKAIRDE